MILAAKNPTKTIPIVMTGSGLHPVNPGFIHKPCRPCFNITGFANLPSELPGSGWSYSKKRFPNLLV